MRASACAFPLTLTLSLKGEGTDRAHSVSDSLSLPEPFSRPEVQILMIFLGVLLMFPAAVVVILQVAKRLAPQLMNRPPQYSRSEREKDNDANH